MFAGEVVVTVYSWCWFACSPILIYLGNVAKLKSDVCKFLNGIVCDVVDEFGIGWVCAMDCGFVEKESLRTSNARERAKAGRNIAQNYCVKRCWWNIDDCFAGKCVEKSIVLGDVFVRESEEFQIWCGDLKRFQQGHCLDFLDSRRGVVPLVGEEFEIICVVARFDLECFVCVADVAWPDAVVGNIMFAEYELCLLKLYYRFGFSSLGEHQTAS